VQILQAFCRQLQQLRHLRSDAVVALVQQLLGLQAQQAPT
jgi:hypothetical protein